MKKIQKLIVGLLTVLSIFSLVSFAGLSSAKADSNQSSVSAIKKRGYIRIAVFGDLQPYGWVNKDGKRVGYDVRLARQIAKDLGVKVKFVQVNANNRVDTLNSNKADLVLANFTVTDERKQVVDFAKPYMKVSIGVVSLKSDPITKGSQLKNKSIIINKGTTAENYFVSNQSKLGIKSILKFDTKTQQFNALKNKRANALADDNSYLYAWVKKNPKYTVGIKTLGPSQDISPAVKKGNKSLLNWTNKEITKLNKDGFFKTDFNKELKPYFGSEVKASDIIITNDK